MIRNFKNSPAQLLIGSGNVYYILPIKLADEHKIWHLLKDYHQRQITKGDGCIEIHFDYPCVSVWS